MVYPFPKSCVLRFARVVGQRPIAKKGAAHCRHVRRRGVEPLRTNPPRYFHGGRRPCQRKDAALPSHERLQSLDGDDVCRQKSRFLGSQLGLLGHSGNNLAFPFIGGEFSNWHWFVAAGALINVNCSTSLQLTSLCVARAKLTDRRRGLLDRHLFNAE